MMINILGTPAKKKGMYVRGGKMWEIYFILTHVCFPLMKSSTATKTKTKTSRGPGERKKERGKRIAHTMVKEKMKKFI